MKKLGLMLAAGFVLTACGGGSDGSSGASSLVRVSAEPAGANCVAGGQRLLAGSDSNGDNQLQDSEVQLTTFACNGPSAQVHFEVARIAVGDLRCPEGGNLVNVTNGSSAVAQPLALCDGAIGAAGPNGPSGAVGDAGPVGPAGSAGAAGSSGPAGTAGSEGAMGATGAVGPEGTAGAEALLPGQFYSTQTVRGATVTCEAVGVTPDGYPTCNAIMVNGMAPPYRPPYRSYQIEAEVICAAITGKGRAEVFLPVSIYKVSVYTYWDGSAWQMGPRPPGTLWYFPYLTCLL